VPALQSFADDDEQGVGGRSRTVFDDFKLFSQKMAK
jgi:hypothetical protein